MIALNSFVAVTYKTEQEKLTAIGLAAELALSLTNSPENFHFVLQVTNRGLMLQQNTTENAESQKPLLLDFVSGDLAYRRRTLQHQDQQLLRAIGVKQASKPRVLDLTGGLAKDAFILACSGCAVTLVERSPILVAMVADALARAQQESVLCEIVSRLQLIKQDSRDYVRDLAEAEYPDVVYLDPMYPGKKKSALVKKEMRMLRGLVGEDLDAAELLEPAIAIAKKVVVKRPRLAPCLTDKKPSAQIEGKSTRFDLYF